LYTIDHDALLRNLTLGTARQDLSEESREWLSARDAVDPTADDAEQLLAAYAIAERLQRLQPTRVNSPKANLLTPPAAEDRQAAPPRLGRGLQLILEGTYPEVLPEAIALLEERQLYVPPHLLPALLERARELRKDNSSFARQLVAAGGKRAEWLARLKPEWAPLSTDYDQAAAWQREATPGLRLQLLRSWREQDPTAARAALTTIWDAQPPKNQESLLSAMETNIAEADRAWLRERLGPKRKGVRRALLRLLLLAGEEQALSDLTTVAAAAFNDAGQLQTVLDSPEAKEILVAYGGLKRGESLAVYLLEMLPPTLLADLVGKTLPEFWNGLNKSQLKATAQAVLAYDHPLELSAFMRFATVVNPAQLPLEEAAKLATRLAQEDFVEIFHALLDQEKNVFHSGGVPRILILSREEPWSERITKAFMLQLLNTLKAKRELPYQLQRDLATHWKLAIPLLHVTTFSWLRTHLHAQTERADAFGKLATDTLRSLSFRRALRET